VSKILVVDDDADQLDLRRQILESAGMEVFTAIDPVRALELFEAHRPESVLLDLHLPSESDGIGLLRCLRERTERRELKVVVVSGWTANFQASPEAALADHVLQKPVRSLDLLRLIHGR
jgi:CheY-like chemotaxis protein